VTAQKTDAGLQRVPAELFYRDELDRLGQWDPYPKPPGWKLSPLAVEKFVLGDEAIEITRKFVTEPAIVTRVVISLCTDLGCLLVGPPGTAKSWFSELLAAAISDDSSITVQGGAVSSIDQLLYTWNKALLSERGPVREALVEGPVLRGIREGKIVRFEELARCPQPLQDALLTILSDRVVAIPELAGDQGAVRSRHGFNIIATSNSIDAGLYSMSAALKRRLNFELVKPIRHVEDEIEVVLREVAKRNAQSGIEIEIDPAIMEILVTIFHELRNGQSLDGRSTDRLEAATMSTAEAVNVAHALSVHAHYYGDGRMTIANLIHFILGTALKDAPDDRRRLLHYFDTEVARKSGEHWTATYAQRDLISA
jgi:MoxR-like ATPase